MKRFLLTIALIPRSFTTTVRAADAPAANPQSLTGTARRGTGRRTSPTPIDRAFDKTGREIPDGLTTIAAGKPRPGHNGWMMTSSALVLFIDAAGLFLFYGGLAAAKTILSVIAQMLRHRWFGDDPVGGLGYSMVFADGSGPFFGT